MATPRTAPLLTAIEIEQLQAARAAGLPTVRCSLDLGLSVATIEAGPDTWVWQGIGFPYPERAKPRTVYYFADGGFHAAARYGAALVKLVPTEWGAPTFEIDGIKMLPTAKLSPYADAENKVALIEPRAKVVLDTCGGLGYFAAWCLQGRAVRVLSFERNADVLWLRTLNPWSPAADPALALTQGDVIPAVAGMAASAVDAVLHDPPRFGIAGELYSLDFYRDLARVLKSRGRLFHYTGSPNSLKRGRDLAAEVSRRLQTAGFQVQRVGDGLLATKK